MKKMLSTAFMILGMTSTAMAASLPSGSATLQWAGSVPPLASPSAGYWIMQDGAVDFMSGSLQFYNDATNGVTLKQASEIGFKIMKDEDTTDGPAYNPAVDINPMQYQYTLSNIKVGIGGFPTTQDPNNSYFAVYADGNANPLVMNTQSAMKTKGEPTRLTIKTDSQNATAPTELVAGADVLIMAVLTVTPDDTPI